MNELIKQGGAILMISSEMPEIVNMCDRVYVMKSGKICGELSGGEIKQKSILEIALLGKLTNNGSDSNKEGVKK
jgi:ABC-type sugar transport system ATPase subunit